LGEHPHPAKISFITHSSWLAGSAKRMEQQSSRFSAPTKSSIASSALASSQMAANKTKPGISSFLKIVSNNELISFFFP
jgi:hypothetical protein